MVGSFRQSIAGLVALVALTISLLSSVPISAQVAGGTLAGTVSDQSGAVIPGGLVSIKNVATGITRDVAADSAGFYSAPNLLPGTYEITVSATGFATEVRSGITLTVGAQQVLNVSMRVGQVTEKIQITGEAPAVQLATSSLGATVGGNSIVEMPLNGRSWTDLAGLQPGVAAIETQIPFGVGGRGNRGYGSQLTISGARPQQNNYRLDGISLNDYANGGPGSVLGGNLGVDAVEEFSVLTGNYSAEYGKTSGGVVNALSRSGTNQFHGSAYWFLRDEDFDARRFFDASRQSFHRNQYGGSAGGPIRKDKTFVFGDYESIHYAEGVSGLKTVPSLAARNGLLCSTPATAPRPCTTQQLPAGPNATPNGTDAHGVDVNIAKYLGLFPLPNGPTLGNGDTATFNFAGQRAAIEKYLTTRIDHHFSEKDSIFGTYMFDRTPFTTNEPLGVVLLGSLTARQIFVLEETHTFSPTLVNTVRLGFNRDLTDNNKAVKALNPLAADLSLGAVPGKYAPICACPGLTLLEGGLGGSAIYNYRWNSYQAYDDAFLTKGLHSLKFGFGFERDQDNQLTITEQTGTFGFKSMQKLLTNQPNKFLAVKPGVLSERGMRQSIVGGYVQDDWRFRPNLTLNLGLRYEMSTVPTEVQGKLATLLHITDPSPHLGDPYFLNPTLRNFAPRVGFAWDPFRNGKTAVRGGFGVFDSLPMLYQLVTLNGRAYPFFVIGATSNPGAGSFPAGAFSRLGAGSFEYGFVEHKPPRNYVMQWNLNIQQELAPSLTATIGYIGSHGVHQPFRADESDMVIPTLTSAGYLWPSPIGSGSLINPNAGSIRFLNWGGSSLYDALQFGIQKRLSHGIQLQGSYTWGKSIDTNSNSLVGDTFSNTISSLEWFNLKQTRGLSDFDVRRTLVINGTWLVPSLKSAPGAAAWVTNGWELTTIFKANDGVPFSALFGTGGDPMGTNSADDYAFPNRLAGCNPINTSFKKSPTGLPIYVNSNCFAVATAPSLAFYNANCDPSVGTAPQCFNLRGNSGRNIMIGPGLANLDFSIIKNNYIKRISENFNVQFRAEFFNVLNRANFNVPDLASTYDDIFDGSGNPNPSAGLLSTLTTDPREIQFALKIVW
jgi:hypothetical protein